MRMIHTELTQLANRYVGLNTEVIFDSEADTFDQHDATVDTLVQLEDELEEVSGEIPVMTSPYWSHLLEAAKRVIKDGDGAAIQTLRWKVNVIDEIQSLQRRKEELEDQIDRARRRLQRPRYAMNTLEGDHAACRFIADTAEQMKSHILAAKAETAVAQ